MKQLLKLTFDFYHFGKGRERCNANGFLYYVITTFSGGGDELVYAMTSNWRLFSTINESRWKNSIRKRVV